MGLVDKNSPIFFYRNLPKSPTGRACDEVVTPSGKTLLNATRVTVMAQPPDFSSDAVTPDIAKCESLLLEKINLLIKIYKYIDI